jgi:hypothetical protein
MSWRNNSLSSKTKGLSIFGMIVGSRREKLRAEMHTQHTQGRVEGRVEEAARAVLTALRVRGIAVSEAARERIVAQKEPETLERWLERAIVAVSLAEVLEVPS